MKIDPLNRLIRQPTTLAPIDVTQLLHDAVQRSFPPVRKSARDRENVIAAQAASLVTLGSAGLLESTDHGLARFAEAIERMRRIRWSDTWYSAFLAFKTEFNGREGIYLPAARNIIRSAALVSDETAFRTEVAQCLANDFPGYVLESGIRSQRLDDLGKQILLVASSDMYDEREKVVRITSLLSGIFCSTEVPDSEGASDSGIPGQGSHLVAYEGAAGEQSQLPTLIAWYITMQEHGVTKMNHALPFSMGWISLLLRQPIDVQRDLFSRLRGRLSETVKEIDWSFFETGMMMGGFCIFDAQDEIARDVASEIALSFPDIVISDLVPAIPIRRRRFEPNFPLLT